MSVIKFEDQVLTEWPADLVQGKQLIRESGKPRDAWFGSLAGEMVLIKKHARIRIAQAVNTLKPLFGLPKYESFLIVAQAEDELETQVVRWYPDAIDLGRRGKEWAKNDAWIDRWWEIILFDQLMSMGDRYEANALVRGDELIPIDEVSAFMWDRPINRLWSRLVDYRLLQRRKAADTFCTRVQSMGTVGWHMVEERLRRYWAREVVAEVMKRLGVRAKELRQYLNRTIGRMLLESRKKPWVAESAPVKGNE